MATYNDIKKIKIGDNIFNLYDSGDTTYSAGTGLSLSGTTLSVKLGYTTSGNNRAVQADSDGNLYVTQVDTNTDSSVKSTALTTAQAFYITGSTTSSTTTSGLYKHADATIYVSANSTAGGISRLTLGNNTKDSTAGGKHGVLRLYGTSTSYCDLVCDDIVTAKTITLPHATGTLALNDLVTQTSKGLMSSADKTKLDSIPQIYTSTVLPTSTDGNDGDLWIVYVEPEEPETTE